MINNGYTRLRTYSMLDGYVLTYSVDMEFVLIGGRYCENIVPQIREEMRIAGCDTIDLLHIPSWNCKMCSATELPLLLAELMPTVIEIPSYMPDDENGKQSQKTITDFCADSPIAKLKRCLPKANMKNENYEMGKVLSPYKEYDKKSDNSVVEYFNHGRFSVLSTGIIESKEVVDDINNKFQLPNPYVLVIDDMEKSPFVSMHFMQKSSPLIILDMHKNNKFYLRSGVDLKYYGISTKKSDGDVVIISGIRKNDSEINTPSEENIGGSDYRTE